MLYTDIPTEEELNELDAHRGEACVSIYLPTHAVTTEGAGDRIVFRNLVDDAVGQLEAIGFDKRAIAAIKEQLGDLHADDDFWAHAADGLAVFATDDDLRTFRLPGAPKPVAMVADRFHLKPLLPLITAPETGYVLALAQGSVRLIEVTAGSAAELHLGKDLSRGMSGTLGIATPFDRAPSGRIQGGEGHKVLTRKYFRAVNRALRALLAGHERPLILACVDYEAPIYAGVNSYPFLAAPHIPGNPEAETADALAAKARPILAAIRAQAVAKQREAFEAKVGTGLAGDDPVTAIRAAINGRVETLFVDVDRAIYGTADNGTVVIAEQAGAESYDLIDEAASATLRHHGDVLAVSADEMPTKAPIAGIWRWREDL